MPKNCVPCRTGLFADSNGTPGVAEINSFGGELKQYEVAIDPNRLKAMGTSITEIFTALEKNNQNTGGAYIDKKPNAYFIRGIGLVTSSKILKILPLKMKQEVFRSL
jgi:cobalt-zinc-cadmium resistance protein CzcA